VSNFNGKSESDIKGYVTRSLGAHYALGGAVALQQLGLDKFPVNATHKIMKLELERKVLQYLEAR
jgi:hypothetical protein